MMKYIYLNDFENRDEAITEAETLIKKWGYDEVHIVSRTTTKIIKIVRK